MAIRERVNAVAKALTKDSSKWRKEKVEQEDEQ